MFHCFSTLNLKLSIEPSVVCRRAQWTVFYRKIVETERDALYLRITKGVFICEFTDTRDDCLKIGV